MRLLTPVSIMCPWAMVDQDVQCQSSDTAWAAHPSTCYEACQTFLGSRRLDTISASDDGSGSEGTAASTDPEALCGALSFHTILRRGECRQDGQKGSPLDATRHETYNPVGGTLNSRC